MTSLFISYSRKDTQAASKLTEAFKQQELDFWIDWEGIPPTVDWWKEIEKGIEEADIFLFLISPDSAKSKICRQEIEHAVKNGKRLIPVVVRDINVDESPSELSHLNWLFFRETDEFNPAFDRLLAAIRTDYEWAQVHRQLQVKALEWERSGKDDSFLLQGKELQGAEFQLATNTSKEPHPTDLQREYVFKSRQASDVRRRRNRIISIGVIIALAVLSVIAFVQAGLATTRGNEAQEASTLAVANARTAQANEQEAQKQEAIALARELAATSMTTIDSDPDLALHLAVLSLDKMPTLQGEEAVRRAILSPPVELTLLGHSGTVFSVEYDGQGKRLVTASADGTARIWDARTGKELMELRGHAGAVKDAAFSPNGNFVGTVGEDGTVRIWDATTGGQLRSMQHGAAVNSVAFSPDGQTIVTASDDKTARVWQVADGKKVHILREHTAAVLCALFSPDGELIVTGGNDQRLNLWDAATGTWTDAISNGSENVNTIAFSADSQYILFDWLYRVHRWDIQNQFSAKEYIGGHNWYITSAAFNPTDGRQVVTASRDHTVRVWDTESGTEIDVLRGQDGVIYSVAFDPSGDHLATASEDHTVRIWNLAEWRKRVLIGYSGYLGHAVYSSDGSRIATTAPDGMIRIWDASTGLELRSWDYSEGPANRLQFSPDDKQIITSGEDGTWRLWDAETGKLLYESDRIGYVVSDARFNRDGTRIITAERGNLGVIWDAETKKPLFQLEGHGTGLWTGMFSADGRFAVTASADRTARVWDAQTGELLHTLSGHNDLVTSAAFSPDGKRIVTASVDGTARIWDTDTGKTLLTLKGHTSELTEALFSPTDPYVATASRDHTVILWNADTGDKVAQLFGHRKDIFHIAFSPDGRNLITTSLDGTARIFPVLFEDVLALARSLLSPRELTCAELIKYLHDETCTTPTPVLTPNP